MTTFFERLPSNKQQLIVDYIKSSQGDHVIRNALMTHYAVSDILDLANEAGIAISPEELVDTQTLDLDSDAMHPDEESPRSPFSPSDEDEDFPG